MNSDGYYSVGTAYQVVSDTAVPVTASSSIVAYTSTTSTGIYRLVCSQDCHVKFGVGEITPTATTSNTLLVAGVPEYFVVPPRTKLGVVRASSDGKLHLTRMKK